VVRLPRFQADHAVRFDGDALRVVGGGDGQEQGSMPLWPLKKTEAGSGLNSRPDWSDQAYSRRIPRCYRRVQRSLQWGLATWRAFLRAVKSWPFSGPEAEDLLEVGMPSLVSRAWWAGDLLKREPRSRLPPTRRYVIHRPRETSHFLKHVLRTGGVARVGRVSMKGSSCFVLFGVLPW
jgi:hypothetical protein